MELNVWTSSTATKAVRDESTGKWSVTVKRGDSAERIFNVDHVIFALGLGGGAPKIPNIPGQVSISIALKVLFGETILMSRYARRSSKAKFCIRPHTALPAIIWGRRCSSLGLAHRVCTVGFRPLQRCTADHGFHCVIAHDIAADYADHGVGMYPRCEVDGNTENMTSAQMSRFSSAVRRILCQQKKECQG